jgi:nucleoside-diphosphate kinase
MERTLALIKPDAVKAKNTGKIIDRIEHDGFTIVTMQKLHLTKQQAEQFYAVHKARGFFNELVSFMSSGPIIAIVLEKQNAVQAWRDLMGETDATKAAPNTLRRLYGTNVGENATHGSDSLANAQTEIAFFFPQLK